MHVHVCTCRCVCMVYSYMYNVHICMAMGLHSVFISAGIRGRDPKISIPIGVRSDCELQSGKQVPPTVSSVHNTWHNK